MSVTAELNGYGPLAGLVVVELCEWVAAPAGVRLLAEMGAEVIKVEPPHGDAQRTQGPGFGADRNDLEDPIFDLNNTNKNWVCLNLKTPAGQKIFRQLLANADVFVTSLRDRALVKLGLDYETLRAEFPGLIWAQNRGYGESGPERDTPGFDAVAWAARGGVAASFPEAGSYPAIPPQAFGDYNHSNVLAMGILAALFNRTRTGAGEKVSANLYGTAIWGGNIGIMATQFGALYPKSRRAVPNPFNNTYQTADGEWILVCMPQYDKYFAMMMEILGLAEHADDPTIRDLPSLKASGRQADVIALLEGAFASRTFPQWETVLRQHQVPHQRLFSYSDVIEDPEARLNDSVRPVEYESFGVKYLPMSPVRLASHGDPPVILSKPLGYHTAEYLADLGYSDEQIDRLEQDGAIKCWRGQPIPDRVFESLRRRRN
ncbi:MAG: CoA transferase [Bifidobacteriaceae bacterium]|jgi:crotonobetainyl-CoA:carnitine CoA-transferase CaiB-like acyl-CoA transferase|nr:CoA transferase [Bifidobacteriaceae bacterium]